MKNCLSRLFIVRKNGSTGNFPSNDNAHNLAEGNREAGVKKLESGVLMGSEENRWEIAYLYDARMPLGAPPLHCYHHSTGTQHISKEEAEQLRLFDKNNRKDKPYRAYIIPTAEEQKKGKTPDTKPLDSIEDGRDFLKTGIWRVQVYDALTNCLVQSYIH